MRLLRLKLEHWRGVGEREIQFSDGVTLIEGPNEVGKSTLIEALQMLFRELHSSKRKDVKAIQPVGQDVGSSVEAEVQAGEHHFVFAKTFNRTTQTTLQMLAPNRHALTGREAHDAALALLADDMDMALWDALLVDQGERVGLANLAQSGGLAAALDEAAGNAADALPGSVSEDSSLLHAAQAEYETYFTLKSGKPRQSWTDQQQALADARAQLADSEAALAAVQSHVDEQQRLLADVDRLQALLPSLEKSFAERDAAWQSIAALHAAVTLKQQEQQSAVTARDSASRELQQRQQLIHSIKEREALVAQAQTQQQPLAQTVATLANTIAEATATVTQAQQQVDSARAALTVATADLEHLQRSAALAQNQQRQQQLQHLTKELEAQAHISASIRIDDAALTKLRTFDRDLEVARRAQQAAATGVRIEARTAIELSLNEESVGLSAAQILEQTVASELRIDLPEAARITITPSNSVAELASQTASAEQSLREWLARLQVADLGTAIAEHERRRNANAAIKSLKAERAQLLQQASVEELEQLITTQANDCSTYLSQRTDVEPLPEHAAAAEQRVKAASNALKLRERALAEAQARERDARSSHASQDDELRTAQQELAGTSAALQDRRSVLEAARAAQSDAALEQSLSQAEAHTNTLTVAVETLQASLQQANPDAAQALRDNAEAVLERARLDLADAQQRLALQSGRLEQLQANGLFEARDAALRAVAEHTEALTALERRAYAAQHLWRALNAHRDAAREAYVAPLKQAVEQLGRIVFGADFAVDIDDDWSIRTRTLNNTTLAFADLSVGTREQLGILMRLAAAQLVSSQGGVPLLIDDALGFSDPARLATMGAAIAAAGRRCQIIILTCAPDRFTHVGNATLVKLAGD